VEIAVPTETLKRALLRVDALMKPPDGFTSGVKVYDPNEGDTSESATLKRTLFTLADKATVQAQRLLDGQVAKPVAFDSGLIDQVDSAISVVQRAELRQFAFAIEVLVSEVNSNI
jgi:hypothetical protein